MPLSHHKLHRFFAFAGLVLFSFAQSRADDIDFERDIAPIFEERCWYCHGEDEQESELRLDRRVKMLKGGNSGLTVLTPGAPEKSYLIEVIKHLDPKREMPPDEEMMPAEEIELIARWIKEGAVWPGQMDEVEEEGTDHWAFMPLSHPKVPTRSVSEAPGRTEKNTDDSSLTRRVVKDSPIDAFLWQKLNDAGLDFSKPADARAMIRRVSIVLTGLAATPERTDAFAAAFAKNPDAAYAELVEELLASPHFGERWAQHWLDVIRWAETNGSESNLYRKNSWMYRDYVVRSFNEDKPYNDFVREQIAGDIIGHGDATGFLVAGPHVPAATVGQEPTAIRQARADRIDEVLQTVGASVMGVTIGCARCHNHKFDPISIHDYYSMSAAFQDVEFGGRYPELSDDHPRVIRDRQLRGELASLRKQMRSKGWAWMEDWTGYQEVHFPPKTVDELKLSFDGRWVMMDEMEIFESAGEQRNVLASEFGTVITDNPVTNFPNQPPENLNNGVFGTKGWRGVSPKDSEEKPWLEIDFPETVTVGTIRLSSNREDFFETDYLEEMNKTMYGEFNIELRDADGKWKRFASTAAMKKRTKDDEKRQVLQEQIQDIITELLITGPQPAFLASFVEPVDTFVFARGSPESPRDQVYASAPKLLHGDLHIDADSAGPMRRKAFADWLVNPENALTSRVMANRLWHHIFGTGIVSTPSDFGKAGALPTHPELLDWLAGEFVKSGWSMKEIVRMIVMSQAFRQSSVPNDAGLAKDASASLLWRFPPRRVEAEVIRDSVLQSSGSLDESIGGPSYRIHNVKKRYAQWEVVDNHGDETWRRMLYQERMRRVDDQIFTAFDFPDCGQIRAKRPVSTTPLQALNLMNSEFVVQQSELLAKRAKDEAGSELKSQVTRCFELLFCRTPSDDELTESVEFAKSESLALLCRTLINTNEFAFVP